MPLNLTNVVQTAQQLLAYTAEAPNFSDKVDVIFVAEMIEKIGKFAEKYKEVSWTFIYAFINSCVYIYLFVFLSIYFNYLFIIH